VAACEVKVSKRKILEVSESRISDTTTFVNFEVSERKVTEVS